MPSLFDERDMSLEDDRSLSSEKLERAINNEDERMQRELDKPSIDRDIEIDKGLQDIRDQALRDIDDRDKNGGQGRADSQGSLMSAMYYGR